MSSANATAALSRNPATPLCSNEHLLKWVEKIARLTRPAAIHWVDGSQTEYDFIHSDADEQEAERADVAKEKVSWFKLLTFRQTWAFVTGKFLTDPIWWFFLFWLPSFLNGENNRKVKEFMTAFPTDPNTLKINEYLAVHAN